MNFILSSGGDGPMVGAQRVIVIVGAARCERWKRAPMKRFVGATVPKGHGGARCDGEKGPPMKYAGSGVKKMLP